MDSSEIDFSKENIQPLKEGRLASYLGTALTAQCNVKSQNELVKGREKFELELRKYKGDDPLEVWYNYICWVIQVYPSNEVADITTLIHKCVAKFKDEERYKQDLRYVKICIKYIEMQRDPFETYDMIHKHGIGSKCAEFYKSWAEEYEKAGNFKQASFIYAKGYDYGAQPASELAQAQRNFEDRVARHFATKSEVNWMESNGGCEQRQALSALATTKQGRDENVGSLRTGSAIIGSAGVLKPHRGLQQQQKPVEVQIYKDHFADSRNSVHLENVPMSRGYNQENVKKPGKWNKGYSKRPAPPITSTQSSVPFKLHEDPSTGSGLATPGGLRYSQNVFKVRKVEKDDYDCPLAIFEPADPTKVVMYCKEKVYSGGTEFSLEEIRGIKYMEAEEKRIKELAKIDNANKFSNHFEEKNDEGSHQITFGEEETFTSNDNFVTPKNVKRGGAKIEGLQEGHRVPNLYDQSLMQQFDFMSAPSPTINTRAANAMVNELFSSTFTQLLGDSMLAMPHQPLPNAPKFEIPCDDNATFPDIPDEEEKVASQIPKSPAFSIHCSENMLFQETPLNDENSWKPHGSQDIAKDWGSHIPFVPPPKDEKYDDDDDSSKENYIPQDYQPPTAKEKRPLAGILLPSKNVPFKPLGEEEEGKEEEKGGNAKAVEEAEHVAEKAGESNAMGPPPSHKNPWETSFECEMLRSLNDMSQLEMPIRRKNNMCGSNEVGLLRTNSYQTVASMFPQKSNGGFLFKQKSTLRTIETEIRIDSKSSNNSILQQPPIVSLSDPLRGDNNVKSAFGNRDLWGESHSAKPVNVLHENSMSESPEIVENPMDRTMLETLLGKVAQPVSRSANFYRILQSIPYLKTNDVLNLRKGLKLTIQRVIGSTADAKVFLALNAEEEFIAIKYQHISCEWEFYIVREIRNRLKDPRMIPAFSNILEGYLFNADSSMLLMKHLPNGTFLDLLNVYKKRHYVFPEVLVLFFTIDIINSVRHLHGCNIIDGSIRPENLLVGNVPNVPSSPWNEKEFRDLLPVLQLINLGKCIDTTLFPRNVRFTSTTPEDQYQCIEMQNGKPWTNQIDLYGIAFTMHCMIFGEFMDISCQNGIWNINRKVPSHFNSGIWNNLFHSLLNVPSCAFIPDLQFIQAKLQEFMFTFEVDEFKSAIANMKTILEEEHKRESNKIRAFKYV